MAVSEIVHLQLAKSFCLPMLPYCIGALILSKQALQQLCVCWNNAYREVFHYKRYESVKELQYFCGDLPFDYTYDILRWSFYSRMIGRNKYLDCLFALDTTFKNHIIDKYHPVNLSNYLVKKCCMVVF